MEKPNITLNATAEDIQKITDTKGGKKIVGNSRIEYPDGTGKAIFFLEDGSEIIEDHTGKKLAKWDK